MVDGEGEEEKGGKRKEKGEMKKKIKNEIRSFWLQMPTHLLHVYGECEIEEEGEEE